MRNVLLLAILMLAGLGLRGDPADKNWAADPEWVKARYGAWGGPGVNPAPGPMDAVALKDYAPKPSLIVTETSVPKAKYPAIDVHAHVNAKTPEQVRDWVRTMDETGIETTVILTGATGDAFDRLVDLYLKSYPGRFQLFCGIDTRDVDKPDYPARAAAELARCYKRGARGVGELTDKGTGFGGRLHPDDPRLDAFWDKCAELNIPANIHIADHPSCWKPLDVYQERTPDYQHFNLYGKNLPSWEELIAMRDRTLAKHPKDPLHRLPSGQPGSRFVFVGRYAGPLSESLCGYLGARLRSRTGAACGGEISREPSRPGFVRNRHGTRKEHVPGMVAPFGKRR